MSEIELPIMIWQEFNALRDEALSQNSDRNFLLPYDWSDLPIVDMGSKGTAGKLVNAIMARFQDRLLLNGGREV